MLISVYGVDLIHLKPTFVNKSHDKVFEYGSYPLLIVNQSRKEYEDFNLLINESSLQLQLDFIMNLCYCKS